MIETRHNESDIELLESYLEQRDFKSLIAALRDEHEVDVADFMEILPDDKTAFVFRMLPKEMSADVFANLEPETQQRVVESFSDAETTTMLNDLFIDDAVDFIEEMPANMVNRLLRLTPPEKRKIINRYLQYPEDSAGSIMTSEYTRLKKDMTVADAIAHLRKFGEDRETIYTCYVTDDFRILEGVLSVRSLLLSDDAEVIADIMQKEIFFAATDTDQEEVVQLMHRYDLLSLPVVDKENRLVGIVTVDDAVDVIHEEVTEDFEKMAAMSPSERPYLKTPAWVLGRKRIVWLLFLMLSGMLNGLILQTNEAAFVAYPLLVSFIPMLTGTGGNVGSQTSTLMIRGMTLGEIKFTDIFKVIGKEASTSMMIGLVLGVINFLRVFLLDGSFTAALILSLSMIVTVFVASFIGGILPLVASKFNVDPAVMAAPLITTIVDAVSLVIYFSIARALLPL